MKLHELQPSPGSHHARKRVGRGPGSGHGKTATRGQKGQGARTSVNLPKTFEGGQTRLTMRIPKLRGFHNKWRKHFAVLNLTRLNRFEDGTEVRPETLLEAGIIKNVRDGIKVLGTGDLRRKLTIHAHRFSAEAKRKIEAAGGTAAVIEVPPPIREKTKRAKNRPKPAPAPEKAETPEVAETTEATEAPGTAAAPAKASKKAKAEPSEKGEKGGKGQPARASASEDSPKPDKGKKKS
ncbi:MAG: large subunit ribosomal protein [Chloroflexota bacterium]|nr:large subunit ribosomal protein [Chloroflexota bacterium]